ncbi:MAG: hypothetical protein WKF70_11990 [Chitinophagaceae bacterium]
MKTILSILFYCSMAGTTASVGSDVEVFVKKNAPVTGVFKAFGVVKKGTTVSITWAAASNEITHFIIERSSDGQCFKPVATMHYTMANAFKYTEQTAVPPSAQYRIAAVKHGGTVEYSKTKKLRTRAA